MAKKEALQNARVWARRMSVELDQDKLIEFLDTHFPEGILHGPLTAVMCRYLKGTVTDANQRFVVARIIADTIVAIQRGETTGGNILAIVADIVNKYNDSKAQVIFTMYSQLIIDTVVAAINARHAEKSKPSVGNVVANMIKRR